MKAKVYFEYKKEDKAKKRSNQKVFLKVKRTGKTIKVTFTKECVSVHFSLRTKLEVKGDRDDNFFNLVASEKQRKMGSQ